jgi:hypothetical protein
MKRTGHIEHGITGFLPSRSWNNKEKNFYRSCQAAGFDVILDTSTTGAHDATAYKDTGSGKGID